MNQIKTIGFIMDGNRRWAVENGLNRLEGHNYGADKLIEVIDWVKEEEIENMVVYALSTENLKRTKIEVELLFRLFEKMFLDRLEEIVEKEVSLKFLGDLKRLPKKLQKILKEAEERTENFKTKLFVAVAYDGRLEIVEAAKKIKGNDGLDVFEKNLWSSEIPEIDLVVRTGGNKRLSGFMLWQASYSELYFIDTKWPAFSKKEFLEIIEDFKNQVKINKGK